MSYSEQCSLIKHWKRIYKNTSRRYFRGVISHQKSITWYKSRTPQDLPCFGVKLVTHQSCINWEREWKRIFCHAGSKDSLSEFSHSFWCSQWVDGPEAQAEGWDEDRYDLSQATFVRPGANPLLLYEFQDWCTDDRGKAGQLKLPSVCPRGMCASEACWCKDKEWPPLSVLHTS